MDIATSLPRPPSMRVPMIKPLSRTGYRPRKNTLHVRPDVLRGRNSRFPHLIFQGANDPDLLRGRLLLVSYHFPPGQAAGALRWQQFSKYAWERGLGLDVVTLDPSNLSDPDPTRLAELPPAIRVYGAPQPPLRLDSLEQSLWELFRAIRTKRRPVLAPAAEDHAKPTRPESLSRREFRRWGGIRPRPSPRVLCVAGIRTRRSMGP